MTRGGPGGGGHFWSLRWSSAFAFRVLLAGILVSTGAGVIYALTNHAAFVRGFPGAAAASVYGSFLLLAGIGVVALAGLWFWRQWAVVLYGLVAGATMVVDRVAGAPPAHEVAVLGGAAAVFVLAYLNRGRFSRRAEPARSGERENRS